MADFDVADDREMRRRGAVATEFYDAIGLVEGETRPWLVTDEAALYDIQAEEDEFVVRQVEEHYGVTLSVPDDFRRPFWQLLDHLQAARRDFG